MDIKGSKTGQFIALGSLGLVLGAATLFFAFKPSKNTYTDTIDYTKENLRVQNMMNLDELETEIGKGIRQKNSKKHKKSNKNKKSRKYNK